jgi:ribosomal protein S18 acetylase RimI-like enzyme
MDETMPTHEPIKELISVEVARPVDAEAVAAILTSSLEHKVAHGDMAWGTEPYTVDELQERIAKGNTYIARVGGVPVGTLLLIWEDELVWGEQPPIAAYVHSLAVKDGYRGMDLGKQLIDWADQRAASEGRELLRIDFPPENDGLRAYYEKLGFTWVQDKQVTTPHKTYTATLYERRTKNE